MCYVVRDAQGIRTFQVFEVVIDEAIQNIIEKAMISSLCGTNRTARPASTVPQMEMSNQHHYERPSRRAVSAMCSTPSANKNLPKPGMPLIPEFLGKPSPTTSRNASPSPSRNESPPPKLPEKKKAAGKFRKVPAPDQSQYRPKCQTPPPDQLLDPKQPSPSSDSEEDLYDKFSLGQKIGSESRDPDLEEEEIYDNPDASKLDVQHVSENFDTKGPERVPEIPRPKSKSLEPEEDFDAPSPRTPSPDLDDPFSSFETQKRELENEPWYFGEMNSQEATKSVISVGDFLVRESSRKKGQFVLTVRNADRVKHLNLLDEDGMVVNETRSFESVKEFIDYHIKTKDYIVIGAEKYFLGQPIENPYIE
jgi:hypothetical protein